MKKPIIAGLFLLLLAVNFVWAAPEGSYVGISGYVPYGNKWVVEIGLPSNPKVSVEGLLGLHRSTYEVYEVTGGYYSGDKTRFSIGGGVMYDFKEIDAVALYSGGRISISMESNGTSEIGFMLRPIIGAEYSFSKIFSTSFELSFPLGVTEDNITFRTVSALRMSVYF